MKKLFLLLVAITVSLQVFAQTTVTGIVTDEGGDPIPGANVTVKGVSGSGTITNLDGEYSIKVPSGSFSLIFSFVGMATQEVSINGRTVVDIQMNAESIGVDEVVVTALGVAREKKALGYAVQEVGADDLTKSSNTNLLNSVNGKVAGVNVTSSAGTAGGSSFITIRGAASITGNNQPLFVVDGVPIDNSMNSSGNPDNGRNNLTDGVSYSNRAIDINPNDIASMSVLKGGAATALYGLRAANGVVMITTKKGNITKGKKINVSVSSSIRIDAVSQLPEMQTKYSQGYNGEWSGPPNRFSWGAPISNLEYDGDKNYIWDPRGKLVAKGTGNGNPAVYYDKYDFFRTGITFNNTIALSGGSEYGTFYMSVGDLESKGIVPNNTFAKRSFLISGEFKMSDKFKFSGSANYIHSGGTRIQQGSNVSGVMLGLLRSATTFDNSAGYEFPEDGRQRSFRGYKGYDNPYWTVNNNPLKDKVDRLIGNIGFEWDIVDNLKMKYKLGIDVYTDKRKMHFAINSNAASTGQIQLDEHFNRDINSDLILSYNKQINDNIQLTLMAGLNMFDSYYQQNYEEGNGIVVPKFYNIYNTQSVLVRESISRKRTAAYYGDFGISIKNMLYLNVTGREEWSTTLQDPFFYPSVSLGFVFSEIEGIRNSFISFGKLRASYSVIANDAFVYASQTVYDRAVYQDGSTSGISYPFNGILAFTSPDVKGNKGLKPEKMKSLEVGLEMKFFKNRLGFDISYYDNQNEDLILSVPISGTTGYTNQILNAASMYNKGIELVFSATPALTNSFRWDLLVNFTKNENEVTELAKGVPNVSLGGFTSVQMRAIRYQSYGSIYGTKWKRNTAGELLLTDKGYPQMDGKMVFLGNALPEWTMGITNSFSFKGITLSGLIDIKHGGKMWNGTKNVMKYFGTHKITENRDATKVFEGIIESTGQKNTQSVKLDQYYWINVENGWNGPTEPAIEDAGWIRLREVTLSYQIPTAAVNRIGLSSATVSVTGNNLLLITDYTGVDPETSLMGASNAQGLDYFNMPGTKSLVFGLKLNF